MNRQRTKALRQAYAKLHDRAWHGSYEDWAEFITPLEIKAGGRKGWRERGSDYAHNYRIMNRIGLPK